MLMPNDELKQSTDGKRILRTYAIPSKELKQFQCDNTAYSAAEFLSKNGSPNQASHQLLSESAPPTADTPGQHPMSNNLIDAYTISDSAAVYEGSSNDAPAANKRRRFASYVDAVLLIILALLVFKSGLFSYVRDLFNAD